MKLLIVRHGETEENSQKIIQGRLPGKLTKLGEKQAKELGKKLKKYNINKIYCSLIDRCRQTLELALKEMNYEAEIEYTELLSERDFGKYSGKPRSEVDFDQLDKDIAENKAMGVETQANIDRRIKKFLEKIRQENNQTVLVVSHSNPIRWIWVNIKGMTFAEVLKTIKIENGEIEDGLFISNGI
jgi:broad specificity phosphatase PhoE